MIFNYIVTMTMINSLSFKLGEENHRESAKQHVNMNFTMSRQQQMKREEAAIEMSQIKCMDEHIYEEIEDCGGLQPQEKRVSNGSGKKIVRFDLVRESKFLETIIGDGHLMIADEVNECNKKRLRLKNCHSPSSSSSTASSSSSVSLNNSYLTNSLSSNASFNSKHSLAFNSLIDTFLNRFTIDGKDKDLNNNLNKSNSDTKSSKSLVKAKKNSAKKNAEEKEVETTNNNTKLAFRVTNFTVDELKRRQKLFNDQCSNSGGGGDLLLKHSLSNYMVNGTKNFSISSSYSGSLKI